jgi:hypothetical protein
MYMSSRWRCAMFRQSLRFSAASHADFFAMSKTVLC